MSRTDKNRRISVAATIATAVAVSAPSNAGAVQMDIDEFGRPIVVSAPSKLQAAVEECNPATPYEEAAVINLNCDCDRC